MAERVPLEQAVAALRKTGPATRKAVGKANREASKTVQEAARSNWKAQRIKPSVANRVVKRRATQTTAQVRLDATYPYIAGVNFGALQYRQFRRWVGNQHTGNAAGSRPFGDDYVLFKAGNETIDEVEAGYLDEVLKQMEALL